MSPERPWPEPRHQGVEEERARRFGKWLVLTNTEDSRTDASFFPFLLFLRRKETQARVPAGSPSRGGDVSICVWHKPTELAHSFLFCSCVYSCLYDPLNCISFHTFSQQLSSFSLCSSSLISLPYWSIQLHISLWKSTATLQRRPDRLVHNNNNNSSVARITWTTVMTGWLCGSHVVIVGYRLCGVVRVVAAPFEFVKMSRYRRLTGLIRLNTQPNLIYSPAT